jgi:hypothetical protein
MINRFLVGGRRRGGGLVHMYTVDVYRCVRYTNTLPVVSFVEQTQLKAVLWIRNYFFRIRIRIQFSSEFWIRILFN